MSTYRAPRGMQDWTPDEQRYYRWIERVAVEIASRYGHLPIATPIVEHTEVFERGVGAGTDIVEKEMYSFETQGNEHLTIRPEFTAGIMRAYVENGMHNLPQPVKLYAIGQVLRYERPGMGRYRQHTQLSVEAVGEQDPALDAELMMLAAGIFEALGIGAISFLINTIGCPTCRPPYISDVLVPWLEARRDKLGETDKMRLEKNPLRVLDSKDPGVQALLERAPLLESHLCEECREHFAAVRHYLDLLGYRYEIDPRLVRGLDYYTKTVFEAKSDALDTANNTLCAGGRYDGLVELLGGSPTPAIGFGMGFERVRLVLEELGIEPPPLPRTELYAVWFDPATKVRAFRTLGELRAAGFRTEMAYAVGNRSFKSQMRAADKSPALLTLIFGEQELAEGMITVKEMTSGDQHRVALDELVPWLHDRLHA